MGEAERPSVPDLATSDPASSAAKDAPASPTNGKGAPERPSFESRETTMMAPRHGVVKVKVFGRTDVGLVREHNEDNFLIADLTTFNRSLREDVRTHIVGERGDIVAVCDGMGGAAAGEIASQMAVDTIYECMQRDDPPKDRDDFARRLVTAIEEAGARIFGEAKLDRTRRGMGTTVTAAGIYQQYLFVGQVGDSRAYLLRHGRLTLVTKDQSLVNQLIEAGQLTEEEAEQFEHSNIILQALGTSEQVHVDLTFVELRKGDRLMLCSDGLSGLVHAESLREVLASQAEPIDACKRLTELANAGGGHDNITVIVADFEGEIAEPAASDEVRYDQYALPPPPNDGGEDTVTRPLHIKGSGPKPGADVKRMQEELGTDASGTWPVSGQVAMAGRPIAQVDDEPRGGTRWWLLLLVLLVLAGVAAAVYAVVFRGVGLGAPLVGATETPIATPLPVVRPVVPQATGAGAVATGPQAGTGEPGPAEPGAAEPGSGEPTAPADPAAPDPAAAQQPEGAPSGAVRELPADDLLHAGEPGPGQDPTPQGPQAVGAAPEPGTAAPNGPTTPIAQPDTASVLVLTDAQEGNLVIDGVNHGTLTVSRPRRVEVGPGAHTYVLVINRIRQSSRRITCTAGQSCSVRLLLPQGAATPGGGVTPRPGPGSGRPSGSGIDGDRPRRPRRPGEPIPENPF